jgi:hypothetical protein
MVDDDFEEEFDEDVPTPAPAPVPIRVETRGRKPGFSPKREIPQAPKENPEEDTYAAFHIPERNGIAERKTNVVVGEDILSILAKMLSKIEKIERATC